MKIPPHWICRLRGHREGPPVDTEPTSYGIASQIVTCQRCGQVVRVTLVNDGGKHPWFPPRTWET